MNSLSKALREAADDIDEEKQLVDGVYNAAYDALQFLRRGPLFDRNERERVADLLYQRLLSVGVIYDRLVTDDSPEKEASDEIHD